MNSSTLSVVLFEAYNLCADLNTAILNLNSINANKSIAALTSFERLQSTLAQWRKMLPEDLQWTEDDLLTSPGAEESAYKTFGESDTLFTKNLNAKPMQNSHAHDIHAILVRSSYYYTQYILYRPFVYRALHFPDKLTPTDAEGVGRCLHVSVYKAPQCVTDDTTVGLCQVLRGTLSSRLEKAAGSLSILLVAPFSRDFAYSLHDRA